MIRAVAEKWRGVYLHPAGRSGNDSERYEAEKLAIYNRLAALDGEGASADDVAAIIGNSSWTRLACTECDADVVAVVELGEEPDCGSSTVTLCLPCLEAAAALGRPS